MKTYVQPGEVLEITLGADIASGAPLLMGDVLGISVKDGKNGDTKHPMHIEGVHIIDKTTSETFVVGAVVYWNDSTKKVTSTASTNKKIGIAAAVGQSADTSMPVKLWPKG